MERRIRACVPGARIFPSVGLLIYLLAASATAQTALTVNGTLVIQGGGTNTSTVRYTQATVAAGTGTTTISLSTAFPTLVIRGPQGYAATCQTAGDCWDSNSCLESTPATLSSATSPATPGVPGVCGWSGIELPAQCTGTGTLDAALDDCADLWIVQKRGQSSIPDISARTDRCAGLGSSIATLNASCPSQHYRDAYGSVVFDVIASTQNRVETGAVPLSVADVQNQLKVVGDWYGAYRALNPVSGGDAANTLVWTQTSRVLSGFWKRIYKAAGVPAPGGAGPTDALLDGLFQAGLEADRTVLVAALTNLPGTSQPPITTAPLVEVLGDGLQTISDRLAQVGQYQDLACRFRADSGATATPSCKNGQVHTEIGELSRLLATLNDPTALATLLARPADSPTTFSTPTWTNWRAVFADWSANSSFVSGAVLDALPGATVYTTDLLAPTATSTFQPNMITAGLTTVIQNAQTRIGNLDANGLFDPSTVGVLHAGIQQDRVADVINQAQLRASDLNLQVTNFNTNRLALANSILSEMANSTQRQDIIDQITTRLLQDQQLSADVAGLRTMIEVEEARFGDFLGAYGNLVQFNTDPNTAIQHRTQAVTVSPADAHWPSPTAAMLSTTPLSSFVQGGPLLPVGPVNPVGVQAGDTIRITTNGQWSPTCALSTNPLVGEQMPFGDATPAKIPLATAGTGPEGFLLQVNAGQYTAVANTSVHETGSFTNDTNTIKVCGGFSQAFDPGAILNTTVGKAGVPGVFSFNAHGSEDFCHTHETGTTIRDTKSGSTTNGSDSRLSANFTTGLRLNNTPFTTFPAGSLLLLEVKRGGTTRADLLEVHVLQEPSSAFLIGSYLDSTVGLACTTDADCGTGGACNAVHTCSAGTVRKDLVDLYLAVNDLSCSTPGAGALNLDINQTKPFGSIAVQLGKGMSKALSDLRASEPALLAQGRIGPEQMSSLRATAYDDLRASCLGTSCTLSYFPPQIQTFFDAWVSKELANIERKADLLADQRQLDVLRLQGQQLADDLRGAQDQARVLQLVPDFILKDLGTHVLQTSTRNLMNLVIGELFPIIDLKAPRTLSSVELDTSLLAQLLGQGTLQHLDWSGDLTTWSRTVANATVNISQTLHDTLINQPPPVDGFIALSFPNPDYVPPPEVSVVTTGNYVHASPERSRPIWNALADPATTSFSMQLLPSDVWSATGGTEILVCSEATPVITAFEIYMVRPGQFENYEPLQLAMQIDGNLEFPSVSLDKFYRLDNADWLNQGIQVQSGEGVDLQTKFAAKVADNATPLYRAGNGLSPFTKFDVTSAGLTTAPAGVTPPAQKASELVVVFRVQSQNVAGLHLAPMCP